MDSENTYDDRIIWLFHWVNYIAWNTDTLSSQAGKVAGGDIIRGYVPRLSQRVVVARILAGNRLEDVSRVFDRPSYWAYGVLALTDGDDQVSGSKSHGGLDTYEIADLARTQDTPVCF